jgi:formate dehydrogenase iron-sulfur subunit
MTRVFVPLDSFAVAMGADDLAGRLTAEGAEVIRNGSRGMAWAEPLVEVETGGQRLAYGPVTPDGLDELLAAGLLTGGVRDHPLCLGEIDSHPYLASQQRLVFDRCGLGAPLEISDFSALEAALGSSPDELIAMIEASGLRGRGGAGFPAHIKWRTVADTAAEQRYIVCNADEGDSGTFADRMLMEGDPFRLIEGMVIAGYATGASRGYVYLRSEYPIARGIFERALTIAYRHGLLGEDVLGSGFQFDIELFDGAGAYICGEETALLESLEGKRGQVRSKPPVPAVAGLFGQPTLVHNVVSLASVPPIVAMGGQAYGALGVGASSGTMPFQLSGNISRGGLIELPFGVSLRRIVEEFGGGTLSGRPLKAVQIGGPLGAYLSESELDQPLTYEAMAGIGAGIGHGGMVVFDDSVDLAEQARFAFEFCEVESCGKCTPCRIGSVRGKELLDSFDQGVTKQNLALVRDLCEVMEKASLCQMGGMIPIPVLSALERFPEDFRGSLIETIESSEAVES